MAKPIPEGYHTITMHVVVSPCREAIDWYKKVFGAEELHTMPRRTARSCTPSFRSARPA